jgi:AmmeMemoRadiSam system protein B/AmmeMemoRadiSam system protein A
MTKRIVVAVLAACLLVNCKGASLKPSAAVRPPAVAGAFYPADAGELAKMVDGFLESAAPAPPGDVVALIAPHAGYVYSGPVAAHSYALLKKKTIRTVVVIAPSHYEAFGFSSVYDGRAYATPLGEVPIDRALSAKLGGMSPLIRLSGAGHTPSPDKREHALEVQLPFLQRVLGKFELVAVVMGDQSYEHCRALGLALAKLVEGRGALIVASSDLSHFHAYDEAVAMDRKTLHAIEEWDYLSMTRNFEQRLWEACGGGPIVAAMIAAERLGANQAKLLKYANSGDTAGDRSRVVGYGAMALMKSTAAEAREAPFTLGPGEKQKLMRIARQSVESIVRQHKFYESPAPDAEALTRERGAFVTLREKGELRGCIGYVAPMKPLYVTVRDVAAFAAVRDGRFQPVSVAELPRLEYEISVLSPLRRVRDIKEIVVGQHGLVMKRGGSEGLLLPQVPVEQKWNLMQFLEQTCHKAGLPGDSWKDPGTDIFRFSALVF